MTMITIPRDLLERVYLCLDWICGEGLGPWPPESAPDPDDLYLEIGAIVNPEGLDPKNRICQTSAETESTTRDSAPSNDQDTGTKGHENGGK
jgi:hypothetical protein